jgi:hypothetical protein
MTVSTAIVTAASILCGLVLVAAYIWYSLALSRLFVKLGGEGWKAWVPVLNEAELFTRGGVPAWSVVYFFIPIVQFYAGYLKVTALIHINTAFGRGAGYTVLGLIMPPVWASIVGGGNLASVAVVQSDAASAGATWSATPASSSRFQAPAVIEPPPLAWRDASGYVIPPTPAQHPPARAVTPEQTSISIPPPLPPPMVHNPWSHQPPASDASVIDERTVITDRPSSKDPLVDEVEELDSTIVVDRSPVSLASLELDDGRIFALNSRIVALGRNPSVADSVPDDVSQNLAILDETRTLSKTHATLTWTENGWKITDLGSTNGVVIIDSDGVETVVVPGLPTFITERFLLGKVGMRITLPEVQAK